MAGLAARLDAAIRQVDAAREARAPLGDPDALYPETEVVTWKTEAIRVDHGSLRAEWRGVPADGEARRQALERLRHRLAAVRAELGAPGSPGGGAGGPPRADGSSIPPSDGTMAPGEALEAPPPGWREKLSEILSRAEFGKRQPREPLLARLMKWLGDRLGFLFPAGVGRAVGAAARWIVYTLAGVAVAVVLFVLVRAAMPLFRRDVRVARDAAASAPVRPETPEMLLALADSRTRAGDFRGAVQALFRWVLLALNQAGRLDYDPALTNREHLARLKADAAARAAFEDLSRQFELACYALRPIEPEAYAAFRAGCRRLAGAPEGRT
ncbi:MAG TPA: DUF4129 domain-containing protein [Candidatus Methylomirabilis sp.]